MPRGKRPGTLFEEERAATSPPKSSSPKVAAASVIAYLVGAHFGLPLEVIQLVASRILNLS
jgi:hypothetical protein